MNEIAGMESMIKPDQACELMGVRLSWLYDAVQAGILPYYRLNNRTLRFRPSELRQWLEERHAMPGPRRPIEESRCAR